MGTMNGQNVTTKAPNRKPRQGFARGAKQSKTWLTVFFAIFAVFLRDLRG